MNKPLAVLALIFLIGGIGLGIVALATSNWSEKDDSSIGFLPNLCQEWSDFLHE